MITNNPLSDFIEAIKLDIVNSIQEKGRYATGETIRKIEHVDEELRSILYGPAYIDALEFGRKPTSPGAPAGNPTVYDQIQIWAAAKGIPEFVSADGKQINVWRAITEKIHRYGYPGKPGVLTEPLSDENINNRLQETLDQIATLTATNVAQSLHIA